MLFGRSRLDDARRALATRTEVWRQVGLGGELDRAQVKRARGQFVLLGLALTAILLLFHNRNEVFPGAGPAIKIITVVALAIIGWALARAAGRAIAPSLLRRLEPGTAGTVGFLIRLLTMAAVIAVALRIAGVNASTLAVGGAFTAVVVGLAAQQTVANLFAGLVLLSARPFRVGERVRFVGGALAGEIEGIVGSLGLFYTSLVSGADRVMIPNSMILNLAVTPIREPERVEFKARFSSTTTPGEVERRLRERIETPMRYPPHIALEEVDRDDVVVRIVATPERPADGAKLAGEVLGALRENGGRSESRDGERLSLAR